MAVLEKLEPKKVFGYFEEICSIPHGSENMDKISTYCMEFAKKHNLKAVRDGANNVIIYKDASKGYESAEPVILQGHLDMVCQKTQDCTIDFENDGLDIYVEDGYIKARGTTLGADNGIAVAMILSILDDDTLCHPPIEAVFTTDEEIGMLGAVALDHSLIKGNRMINIDSEDASVVTVSCAGGSDFRVNIPVVREKKEGSCVTFAVKGLNGGHSGVEINSGRVNAGMLMGRILNHVQKSCDFELVSLDGGDKANAIPTACTVKLVTRDCKGLEKALLQYCSDVKTEISAREGGFFTEIQASENGVFETVGKEMTQKLVYMLLCAPGGVVDMSMEIEGLVETSLNMGILKTVGDEIITAFALRSNKKTALVFLEEKLEAFFGYIDCKITKSGHYPPWEYNQNSLIRELYVKKYAQHFGKEPSVEAIHAGLECGVFASSKKDFDCISVGPEMHDIHTVNERLSVASTGDVYSIIVDILKELKN